MKDCTRDKKNKKEDENEDEDDPVVIKDYLLLDTLGVGSFSKVRLGIHRHTEQMFAVKIIDKQMMARVETFDKLGREIRAMSGPRHPHVVHIHEVIDTTSTCYIIMDYIEGGELFDFISQKPRISEYESVRLMRQILSAVNFCHNNRVCHRDIKPENIMLDINMNVKLADFGLCNTMRDGEFLYTPCGSPNYAAPEVITGLPYAGPEIDVWSCGVIFYVLLCGRLPFDDDEMSLLFHKIKMGKCSIPGNVSSDARWLLERMLDVNPASRITLREIMLHPWFSGCNVKENSMEPVEYNKAYHYSHTVSSVDNATSKKEFSEKLHKLPMDPDIEVSKSLVLKFNHYNPRWSIGVTGYKSEEHCVMKILETLKEMGYKWSFAPLFLIHFSREVAEGEPPSPHFSIQIYRIRHLNFVADITLREGKLMPALEEGIKIVETLQKNLVEHKVIMRGVYTY